MLLFPSQICNTFVEFRFAVGIITRAFRLVGSVMQNKRPPLQRHSIVHMLERGLFLFSVTPGCRSTLTHPRDSPFLSCPLSVQVNRYLRMKGKVKGCAAVMPKEKDTWYSTDPIHIIVTLPVG